jgi:signal transduction histidine kinase
VREMVESIGGRAWAEFPEGEGSVFAFSLPSRREDDVEPTKELPNVPAEPAESQSQSTS